MMVFDKKIIVILTLILGVSMIASANEEKDCCIIFWSANPDLSLEYLNKTDYMECKTRFNEYIQLDFEEIERFDQDCQVFYLKKEIDNDRYRQISNHEQFYVSIVIDNKIYLNAINGAALLPARMPSKFENFEYVIRVRSKKYIIISDKLFEEEFIKRDSLDKKFKNCISNKIKLSNE